MGTALIVTTIPEEALDQRQLYDSDDLGNEFLLCKHYGPTWWEAGVRIRELHPNAYYVTVLLWTPVLKARVGRSLPRDRSPS